jgi:hypothetical protein
VKFALFVVVLFPRPLYRCKIAPFLLSARLRHSLERIQIRGFD